jgi:hypothetical protein
MQEKFFGHGSTLLGDTSLDALPAFSQDDLEHLARNFHEGNDG